MAKKPTPAKVAAKPAIATAKAPTPKKAAAPAPQPEPTPEPEIDETMADENAADETGAENTDVVENAEAAAPEPTQYDIVLAGARSIVAAFAAPHAKESEADFLKRVMAAVAAASDAQWETLDGVVHTWYNASIDALEAGNPALSLAGFAERAPPVANKTGKPGRPAKAPGEAATPKTPKEPKAPKAPKPPKEPKAPRDGNGVTSQIRDIIAANMDKKAEDLFKLCTDAGLTGVILPTVSTQRSNMHAVYKTLLKAGMIKGE